MSLIIKLVQVFHLHCPPRRLGLNFSALLFTNLLISTLNTFLVSLLVLVITYEVKQIFFHYVLKELFIWVFIYDGQKDQLSEKLELKFTVSLPMKPAPA